VQHEPPFDEAADPEALRGFIEELEASGFERVDTATWEGPTRQSLIDQGHTDSDRMSIIIRPAWPFLSPLVHVPGISAWHADQERLCIWHGEDASQRWVTLDGILERIDEWAEQARLGFEHVENARNPEIYWQQECERLAGLVDLDAIVGAEPADGGHAEFQFADAVSPDGRRSPVVVYELLRGAFRKTSRLPAGIEDHRAVRGRWMYRAAVPHPPRTVEELRAFLTETQRDRLDRDLRNRPVVMYALVWPNNAGLVATAILSNLEDDGERTDRLVVLRPSGRDALLLRAGPDAKLLEDRSVVLIGAGAIGSHIADQLARAGIGRLRLIDYDLLWPANLIRHAAPPGTPAGTAKTDALHQLLTQYPWVDVEPVTGVVWQPSHLGDILNSADVTIDATGHAGFAELLGRVAHDAGRALISAALFRGGAIARIRRQALSDDTPISLRRHLDRYPEITPLDDETEYVGTEIGCLAFVHNAPPVAVSHAATLASEVAIDLLVGRYEHADELIEILRPGEPPFDRVGRLRNEDMPTVVDLTETARQAMLELSQAALPDETGGVLIGCLVDGRPLIAEAIEVPDQHATDRSFTISEGRVPEVVAEATRHDHRLGYLGEWHSHPDGAEPSPADIGTMLVLAGAEASQFHAPLLLLVHPSTTGPGDVRAFSTTDSRFTSATLSVAGDLPDDLPAESP
jgi:proteasome lid subunit RPN8/RPN11